MTNTVEFIKKFGWGDAVWLKNHCETHDDIKKSCIVEYGELKNLVAAWELVQSYGGLDSCYKKLYMLHELTENPEPIHEATTLVEQVEKE